MKVQAARWGNGTGLRLPQSVVDEMRLTLGSELDLTVEDGEIRLRPARKRGRSLLAEMAVQARQLGSGLEPGSVDRGADRGSETIDDDEPL